MVSNRHRDSAESVSQPWKRSGISAPTGPLKPFLVMPLFFSLGLGPSFAVQVPDSGPKADLDIRLPTPDEARAGFRLRTPTAEQLAAADQLSREVPGLTLRWDGMSASPKWLAGPPGKALSASGGADPESAARDPRAAPAADADCRQRASRIISLPSSEPPF